MATGVAEQPIAVQTSSTTASEDSVINEEKMTPFSMIPQALEKYMSTTQQPVQEAPTQQEVKAMVKTGRDLPILTPEQVAAAKSTTEPLVVETQEMRLHRWQMEGRKAGFMPASKFIELMRSETDKIRRDAMINGYAEAAPIKWAGNEGEDLKAEKIDDFYANLSTEPQYIDTQRTGNEPEGYVAPLLSQKQIYERARDMAKLMVTSLVEAPLTPQKTS